MRRFLSTLTLLAATGFLTDAAPPIHGQTVERQLVVTALDRDRSPVPGLQPDDFIVREDGTRREVLAVSQDTDPRQIAVLVDTSQASERAIADFRNAISAFIDEMAGDHDLSLISFGGPPRILVSSTRNPDRLREGVGKIFAQPGSAAYLLDAMRETTAGFVKREAARPVIVVLGGEGLDHSHTDASTVLGELERAAIAVHTVVLRDRSFNTVPVGGGAGFAAPFDLGPMAQWRLERDQGLNQAPRRSGG